jgi:MFS family permease
MTPSQPATPKIGTPDPERQSRTPILVLLLAGILVNYIDRGSLSVAAPAIMREFALSPVRMGVLLSAFFWTYALLQIPAGYLIDRFGMSRTYAAGLLVWSAASAAVGLAQSPEQILIFRVLLGAGEAIAVPASIAYIRNQFSEHERGLRRQCFWSE